MLIDRTCADGTTAGQGNARLAATGKQGPEYENRRPHGLDHIVWRQRMIEIAGIQDDLAIACPLHADAHLLNQAQHGRHVVEARHILETHRFARQQAGTQNRQGGILRAGNGDLAGKPPSAVDQQLIHAQRSILRASSSASVRNAVRRYQNRV